MATSNVCSWGAFVAQVRKNPETIPNMVTILNQKIVNPLEVVGFFQDKQHWFVRIKTKTFVANFPLKRWGSIIFINIPTGTNTTEGIIIGEIPEFAPLAHFTYV